MTKIVFFGSEDISFTALEALITSGFSVAAVITKPDSPSGRGQKIMHSKIKAYALERNIPVWQPNKVAELANHIAELGKPVGVLVSYGKIIPQSIISLFDPGIINIHPSLLPIYRGPSPVEAAILNGDTKTGVSIMQLNAEMDAGPIYHQTSISLDGSETGPDLLEKLGTIGAHELVKDLPNILSGSLKPQPQDNVHASYCHLIQKTDGIIDWNKPAIQLEREIRAYRGWPQSRTVLSSIDVILTEASVSKVKIPSIGQIVIEKNRLFIGTEADSLEIHTIKPFGKKEMPISAFLAGYRNRLKT